MDQQLLELYNWIVSKDRTYARRYSIEQFAEKIKSQEYADALSNWASRIDANVASVIAAIPSSMAEAMPQPEADKKKDDTASISGDGLSEQQQFSVPPPREFDPMAGYETPATQIPAQQRPTTVVEAVELAKTEGLQGVDTREDMYAPPQTAQQQFADIAFTAGEMEAEKPLIEQRQEEERMMEEATKSIMQQRLAESEEFKADLSLLQKDMTRLPDEDLVNTLNTIYGKYGFLFRQAGFGVNKFEVLAKNGNTHQFSYQTRSHRGAALDAKIAELRDFIAANGTLESEAQTASERPASFLENAYRVKSSRERGMQLPDGSIATVKLESAEVDGKYVVYPTLFPKDPSSYSSRPSSWMELDSDAAYDEAKKRGELYYFSTDEEAKKFAEGEWKEINTVDREFEDFFAERGFDFYSVRDNYNQFMEAKEKLDFIENAPFRLEDIPAELQDKWSSFYIDGKLRGDIDQVAESIEEEKRALSRFVLDSDISRVRQDADAAFQDKLYSYSAMAAEYNKAYEGYEAELNKEVQETLGITLQDLPTYKPQTPEQVEAYNRVYSLYQDAEAVKKEAAKVYEFANTYFNNQFNKNFYGEWVDGWSGVMNEYKKGFARGEAMDVIWNLTLGITDIDDMKKGPELAEEFVKSLEDMNTGKVSREMQNWMLADNFYEMGQTLANDGAWGAAQFAANSLGMMLPYGWKIYAAEVPAAAAAGAAIGATGVSPYTIAGGALAGLKVGLSAAGATTAFAMEYTNSIVEALENRGYDTTNPDAVLEGLRDDRVWQDGGRIGIARGLTIGSVSYIGGALSGRIFKIGSLATMPQRAAATIASTVGTSQVFEGVGEAAAQVISGQYGGNIRWKEVVEEMMGSFGMAGTGLSTAAISNYASVKLRNDVDLANRLTNIEFISRERSSDSRISSWANEMERLGKISPEVNQRIQENVGLRRDAREILNTGFRGGVGLTETSARSSVEERVMVLLAAKSELTSTPNRQSVFKSLLSSINNELAEIATTRKNVPKERQAIVDVVLGLSDQDRVSETDFRKAVPMYYIDGKAYNKADFVQRISDMSPKQLKKANVKAIGDAATRLEGVLLGMGLPADMVTSMTGKVPAIANALENVETTKNALLTLSQYGIELPDNIFSLVEEPMTDENMFDVVAKEYHKAKADNSNPALVEAVEKMVAPSEQLAQRIAEQEAAAATAATETETETEAEVVVPADREVPAPKPRLVIARPTRTDKEEFQANTLSEERLDGILAGIIDKRNSNKKLTAFQEQVAKAHSDRLTAMEEKEAADALLDQELKDMETFFSERNPQFQLDTSLTPEERKQKLYDEALTQLSELDNNGLISEDAYDVESAVEEAEMFTIEIKDNTELANKVRKVGLDFLIGKKINLVMADQLVTDPTFDPNDPKRLMGGPFFPLIDQLFGKIAWASINNSAAASIVNGAINADYSVVFNMSPKAVFSNQAYANNLINRLTPAQRKKYYSAIKEYVKGLQDPSKPNTIVKKKWVDALKQSTNLEEFVENISKFSVDQKIELFEAIIPEAGVEAQTPASKYLQSLNIDKISLANDISEQFASELPMGALTMILEITDKQGNKVTEETKKEAILNRKQQEAEGLPTHPNYAIYLRGRVVAMLNETTQFWNVVSKDIGDIVRQEVVYVPRTAEGKKSKGKVFRGNEPAIVVTFNKEYASVFEKGIEHTYKITITEEQKKKFFDLRNPEHVAKLKRGFLKNNEALGINYESKAAATKAFNDAIAEMTENSFDGLSNLKTGQKFIAQMKNAGFTGLISNDGKVTVKKKKVDALSYSLFQDELDVSDEKSVATLEIINAKIAGYIRKGGGAAYTAKEAFANAYRSAQMTANTAYDVVPPMTTQYARFVSLLSRAFPSVEVVTDQEQFDALFDSFYAQKIVTAKGQKVYGFVYQGKLYLNPALANYNTPIHEFGHIWLNVAKNMNPDLYQKGISLIRDTEYVDQIRKSGKYKNVMKVMAERGATKAEIEQYILEEALATAIGDKGESFVLASQKKKLSGWLNRLYSFIKNLTGISKYTAAQLENITIDKFLEGVVVDLLSNEPLFANAQADQMSDALQMMTGDTPVNMTLLDIVQQSRDAAFTDEAIKIFLLRNGFELADIKKALEVPIDIFSNIPPEFGNVSGGMTEGIALYERVINLVNDWRKATTKKQMNDLVAKLKAQGFSDQVIAEVKKVKKVDPEVIRNQEKTAIASLREAYKEELAAIKADEKAAIAEEQTKEAKDAVKAQYKATAQALKARLDSDIANIKQLAKDSIEAAKINNREDLGVIREKAQIFLQADSLYKSLDSSIQMELSISLDRNLGITQNKSITEDVRRMKAMLSDRKQLTTNLNKLKTELRIFIRKNMPQSKWNTSDVNSLMAAIARATPKNIQVVYSDVVEIINRQLTRDAFKLIDKFKATKTTEVSSGRLKGKVLAMSVDRIEQLKRDISTPNNIETEEIKQLRSQGATPTAIADAKIKYVQGIIDQLKNEYETLEQELSPSFEQLDRMQDIQIAIMYNEALLMEDTDSIKSDNLMQVSESLKALLKGERALYRGAMQVRAARLNGLRSKFFNSVTGLSADFSSEADVEQAERAVDQRQNLKDNRPRFRKWATGFLLRLQNTFITRIESTDGLLDLISRETADAFEGDAKNMIMELFDESTRNYYAGRMQMQSIIRDAAIKIYGEGYQKVARANSKPSVKVYTDPIRVAELQQQLSTEANKVLLKVFQVKEKLKKIRLIENEISSLTKVMSQNEMYYLYNQYKDPSTHAGFESKFGPKYKEVMADIESKLDSNVKEWADWQVDVFFPQVYSRYNAVYRSVYLTNMPWNNNYAGMLAREGVDDSIDILSSASAYRNAVGSTSTKLRSNNKAPIRTVDGDAMLMSYIDDMEYFRTHAENMKTVVGIFRNRLIKNGIIATTGKEAYNLLDDKISKTLNRKLAASQVNNEIMNYLTSTYVVSKLGINPTVFLKQLTSALAFADYIGYANWTKYATLELGKGVAAWNKSWQEMYANSPILQQRYDSNQFTKILESYTEDAGISILDKGTYDKVIDFMMSLIKQGDKGGVMGSIPNYAYYKAKFMEQNPNASEQSAINHAIKKVESEINQTQQSNLMQYKDFYQTDNIMYRWLSLFTSSPRALFRKEIYAVRQLSRKLRGMPSKGSTWQNIRTLLTYHIAIPMFFQYVSMGFPMLFRPWRDDDAEELGRAAILGNMNAMFILGDVIKSVMDTIADKPWGTDSRTLPIIESVYGVIENWARFRKARTPETKDKYMKRMYFAMLDMALPATQANKLITNYSKLPSALTEGEFGEAMLRLFNYSDYVIEGYQPPTRRRRSVDPTSPEGIREAMSGGAPSKRDIKEAMEGGGMSKKEMMEAMGAQ